MDKIINAFIASGIVITTFYLAYSSDDRQAQAQYEVDIDNLCEDYILK